ncbi:hypothetical protein [Aeromonas salmonicida]
MKKLQPYTFVLLFMSTFAHANDELLVKKIGPTRALIFHGDNEPSLMRVLDNNGYVIYEKVLQHGDNIININRNMVGELSFCKEQRCVDVDFKSALGGGRNW